MKRGRGLDRAGRQGLAPARMVVGSAVDLLFDSSDAPDLAFTYFGGEPLLDLERCCLRRDTLSTGRGEREGPLRFTS